MVLYDGDHGFLSVKLRDCQFFFGTQFVPTGLHWYPLWLFTWSFGYSSTASDGSPYEKRVDAKGHVLSDKSIADEVPFEKLPVGWAWARLAGVASIQLGKMLDKQKNEGEPVPYLGNANVQWGEFDLANIKTMRMNEADRAKFVLANGDLIVCEGGVPGRCAIWTSNKTMYYQKALHRVRCDKRLLLNTYCELYIRLIVQSHIWDGCFTGTTIKHLPAQTLSGWVLPVPPLAEQRCIVERVDQLMPLVEECGKLEDDREALDAALPERLRKSVLQMAVQGKLVPQDPSDEPASELLERIRDQRRQLIAEKKMRAPKGGESVIFRGSDGRRYEKRVDAKGRESEPVCIEDEIPFEVPNNWEWARLGTLCNFGKCQNVEYKSVAEGVWNLDLEDIEKDSGAILRKKRKAKGESGSTKHSFTSGMVLYSKLRPYLNKVVIADEDGVCSSEILPLSFPELNNEYAQLILMEPGFVEYAKECSYGVKMPRLGTDDARHWLVATPPLEEQHRIVAAFKAYAMNAL